MLSVVGIDELMFAWMGAGLGVVALVSMYLELPQHVTRRKEWARVRVGVLRISSRAEPVAPVSLLVSQRRSCWRTAGIGSNPWAGLPIRKWELGSGVQDGSHAYRAGGTAMVWRRAWETRVVTARRRDVE